MATHKKMVYKIIFEHQEKIYELYARHLTEGALMGFIELEGLLFTGEAVPADLGEACVRQEFEGVKRTYVPTHAVLRIDEVEQTAVAHAHTQGTAPTSNIKPFPKQGNKKPLVMDQD